MKSKIIFLLLMSFLFIRASAQQRVVTGKVTATNGTVVPGVTVTQKGTGNATVTNEQGNYSISLPTGSILVFTSINYRTEEINAGDRTNVNVLLTDTTTTLSDVVVIGYGNQNRKQLTSAITTVKPEEFNRGAIVDPAQLLQGKVAGLNITASGNPNAPAAVILRGASTLNSSQSPFYVIDGIPGADISILAPDDIATFDVLKDAAATAIYGNRAANGVIMVTTKKGRKGQATVSYAGYVGFEKVSKRLEMMNSDELRAVLATNGQAFTPADDKGANTDWQKEVQRPSATSHNHNLSISGGSEKTVYSASINYAKKEGIMRFSDLDRVIVRLALDQTAINDKVKFSLMISNSNSVANNVPYLNT
ncbi:MAG: TonB-dependent receptor plug domain-containing protein, partial [Chitinophagaceae bacterium]|nr:TonB-dependent receptor plug domain-containing protein [Chitinophagaceae bacterium]